MKVEQISLVGLLLGLTLILSACSQPDFKDVKGNGIYLDKLTEKYLVVNYWATWCGPCRHEIPELNKLSIEHSEKVNVVGVNYDHPEDLATQLAQAEKMKIEFPVLTTEPAKIFGVDIPQVLPTTYVFSPGGTLLAKLVGPQTEATVLAVMEFD